MRSNGLNLAAALSLLLAAGCSGVKLHKEQHSGQLIEASGNVVGAAAESVELAQYARAVAPEQLSGLPAPVGLDSGLWQELVSALQRSATGAPEHPISHERFIADDFALNDRNGELVNLSWTYRNPGDYDQNGEVNGADLVFLAKQLGKTPAAPDWGTAQLADGNANGEVEFGDVTPLGQNFGNTVSGYFVLVEWQDLDSNGETNLSDVVPYSLAGARPLSGMSSVSPGSSLVFVSPDDPDKTILGPVASPNPPGPWFCYLPEQVANGSLPAAGGWRQFSLDVRIASTGQLDLAGVRLSLVPFSGPDASGVVQAGRRSAVFTIPVAP